MNLVIFDLEAACREDRIPPEEMEIIEIGAVKLGVDFSPCGEFSSFAKPVLNPVLTDFCKTLTGIGQENIDGAEDFKAVFPKFLKWIGDGKITFCSWGNYDLKQIKADCKRHGIPFPGSFNNHINLKWLFAEKFNCRPCGMRKALNKLGLPLAGSHHRALDDARNIARIAKFVLEKGK